MTDKRARLARIKKWAHDFIPAGETNWLITELEAAWAEVERLNKVSEGWHQESERYRRCAEAAEKRVKRMEEALESLLGISHRIEGCSDSDCLVCRENDRVIEQARAALAESSKQTEEKP